MAFLFYFVLVFVVKLLESYTLGKRGSMRIWARKSRHGSSWLKSFVGDSFVNELHRATGQYANYRSLLRDAPQHYEIYLAIPHDVYCKHFHRELVEIILTDQQIKFFTYDPQKEEVVLWNS